MTSNSQPKRTKESLFINRMSIIGLIVGGAALSLIVLFFVLDFLAGGTNPYTGIITYFVLPMFLIIGLMLVIVGAILRRRRIHLKHPEAMPLFPTLDLNSPKNRRTLIWIAASFIGFLLLSSVGGVSGVSFQ